MLQNLKLQYVAMEWWKLGKSVIVDGRKTVGMTVVFHNVDILHLKNLPANLHLEAHVVHLR